MKSRFAVFDIDGTLIRWQLYHAIVNQLIKQGAIDVEVGQKISAARMSWKNRIDDAAFSTYENTLVDQYKLALTSIDFASFEKAVDQIFATYKEQTYTYTRDLVRSLKQRGYTLLAISGSHQEIVERFGDFYGFDHVIGSRYESVGGKFTGKEFTPVLAGKGILLKQIVDELGLSWKESIAAGDTKSDISMLELVERPIAFNPSRELFNHADEHGWDIVIERKNMVYRLKKQRGEYVLSNKKSF